MNIHSILQLLVLVNEAKTQAEVAAELDKLLRAYGFVGYDIWLFHRADSTRSEMLLMDNWPESWRTLYATRKYSLVDPARRMLSSAQRPFRWRDAIHAFRDDPYRKRVLKLLQDASRFNMVDGYVFPIFGKTGLIGQLNISGPSIELSPVEISLFETAGRRIFWRLLELQGLAPELELCDSLDTDLTKRQMEVLILLADGMTSNEIAKELSISNHTVDWYINVIQEKFNAKNRQHVIAIAFRLGLIT
ncbi:helix-turn-helix transcriptional regulator [Rhizobium sp. SL86]|uniref:helix-turn-helix transcriptional regulator n=1 Tax=Rhizobium sp. SL86 TaxID=2995148 RepID=UPI002273DBC9|nr:LuxR family transcriptional regulator [Rhizobium sp. SL86]MCY1665551.1 LuxR family transcriptional regulator [Rhizobium sp. SL86]